MADYDPNTVSAYQQYGQSMTAGGGGSNMSGLGARQSTSSMTSVPDGPVDFTTINLKTGTQKKVATIDYGSDNDDGPSYVNPTVIYHAAANASEDAGSVLTPTAPMINAANLYSMPNMAEQVYDYVYRADRNDAITSAIRSTQAEEQASVDAAVKSINKAITQGKTDAEIAEAFLNDMGGMGNDKPDETGGFGVPGVTLKDVTNTDEGALSNPQPLYDFAEEMRNPSITVEELPPLTPDQKEKLGAKLREASDKGDLSSVMNQLAQDSKIQLSSAVTNFIEGAETQVASNDIDPITGLPVGGDELGFVDVSPSAEAEEQRGLMARPASATDERVSYWDSVLFGDTEAEAETPAPEAETPAVAEETVITPITETSEAQQKLFDLGYVEVGTADGIAGTNTRSAVRRYQQQNGLEATGELDQATLDSLSGAEADLDTTVQRQIAHHEGQVNYPYKDSRGLWTIGIGHLIGNGSDKALADSGYSQYSAQNPMPESEVADLFDEDLEEHKDIAEGYPFYDDMSDEGKRAILDLTFNMGDFYNKKKADNTYEWANLRTQLNNGDWDAAADNLASSAYARQVGRRATTVTNLLRQAGN